MRSRFFFIAIAIAVLCAPAYAEEITNEAIKNEASTSTTTAEPSEYEPDEKSCRWYRRHCHPKIEGLPEDAPPTGVLITIDTTHNIAYLWRDRELVAKGPATTGSDKTLKRGLRQWLFRTPRGFHKVLRKVVDPIWTKPDWAFIEEGEPVPPPDSPARKVRGHLGKYALDLGDGILIHGTKEKKLLGRKGSHGCIRLGDELLELVYQTADVGTGVYIF